MWLPQAALLAAIRHAPGQPNSFGTEDTGTLIAAEKKSVNLSHFPLEAVLNTVH